MEPVIESLTTGFPVLLLHFSVTLLMFVVGVTIYLWMTPYPELKLIREGNVAAAVSLGGAMVAIAIPLAFSMAVSVSVLDIVAWGTATLLIMLIVYRATDFILKDLPTRIEAGELGPAILLAAIKLGVAAITAAAVSG